MSGALKTAQKLARRGRHDRALETYDRLLAAAPGNFAAVLHKSILLNKLGDNSGALALVRGLQPPGRQGHLLRCFEALYMYDEGRVADCRALAEAESRAVPDSRLATSFVLLACLAEQDFARATELILEQGLPDSPFFKQRFFSLIEKQHNLSPVRPSAAEIAAVEAKVAAVASPPKVKASVEAGIEAYFDWKYLAALEHFLLGYRRDPKDIDVLLGVAEAWSALGVNEQAERYHAELAALSEPAAAPEAGRSFLGRAFSWFSRRHEEEISWPRHYLAKHWVRTGRAEEAIPVFEELLRANSNHIDSHLEIGIANLALGREREARAAFERSLDVDADLFPRHMQNYLRDYCGLDCGLTDPFAKRLRRTWRAWMTGRTIERV